MAFNKLQFLSENVGAKYLIKNHAGWEVETGNVEKLQAILNDIIHTGIDQERKKRIRNNYLNTSTYEIFEQNVLQMFEDNLREKEEIQQLYIQDGDKEKRQWDQLYEVKWDHVLRKLRENGVNLELGPKVILYGAGSHANYIYKILKDRANLDVILWVDKNYGECANTYLQIKSPQKILLTQYDFILAAVINENTFISIKKDLLAMGVEEKKIVWLQWRGGLQSADWERNMEEQKSQEELKQELELVKLRNDELSKMAFIMNTWNVHSNHRAKKIPSGNRLHAFCSAYEKRWIYGAGLKADRAVNALEDLSYEGFVVSKRRAVKQLKLEHTVYEFSEITERLQEENSVLIIALNPANTLEILPKLASVKLNAVYFME